MQTTIDPLKKAWRRMVKYPLYTGINMLGLSLSLFVLMFIYIVVKHESSYDQFNVKANRIYRVDHDERGMRPGGRFLPTVGAPVGPAMQRTFPEVENTVRLRYSPDHIVRQGDKTYSENNVFYVDPSLFDIFTLPFEKGDPAAALAAPNEVVLTHETAIKYFGSADVVGKLLVFDDNNAKVVKGVLKTLPTNFHIRFDFLFPFKDFRVPQGYPVTLNDWGWISFFTYILVKPETHIQDLENRMQVFREQNWKPANRRFKFALQPVASIYFNEPRSDNNLIAAGNANSIKTLLFAGVVLLLLALFNYTNISTALSLSRAKEIGVRKVLGSSQWDIRRQFMLESLFMSVLAFVIALAAFILFVHALLTAFGLNVSFSGQTFYLMVLLFLGISASIGLISGWYPAMILSSFEPIKVLKGRLRSFIPGVSIRNILFPLQVMITSVLIVLSVFIYLQIKYLNAKNLGYAKNELIILKLPGDHIVRDFEKMKNSFLKCSDIVGVSAAGGRMDGEYGSVPVEYPGNLNPKIIAVAGVYPDFFKTIGARIVAGAEMNNMTTHDTSGTFVLNETAVKMMGWTNNEAIGKKIRVNDAWPGTVTGVVSDFNYNSLYTAIEPLACFFPKTIVNNLYIRIKPGTAGLCMRYIQDAWKSSGISSPFDGIFLSDHLSSLYEKDENLSRVIYSFSIVAIIISFLGLFGMVSLIIRFKNKEFGLRKVLGAGMKDLAINLSKDFLVFALVGNVLAVPLAIYLVSKWLNQFEYRINLAAWVFVLTFLCNGALILVNVISQLIKNTSLNPIRALKEE